MYSYFLGPTTISRVKLWVTDGTITNYVPFITNTGSDNPFFSSCHGLYYYHLVVQRFQRNVSLYVSEVNRNDLSCLEYMKIFRYWVKASFLIETEFEYHCSSNCLFKWVNNLWMKLNPNVVDQMYHWIKTKLAPFQNLWFNHKKNKNSVF